VIVVPDAGPLIYLGGAGKLGLLARLYNRVVVPLVAWAARATADCPKQCAGSWEGGRPPLSSSPSTAGPTCRPRLRHRVDQCRAQGSRGFEDEVIDRLFVLNANRATADEALGGTSARRRARSKRKAAAGTVPLGESHRA
jgi:hypothetical protein